MKTYIAERHLFFTEKQSTHKRNLVIRVSTPQAVDQSTVKFPVDEAMAVCYVQLDGLDENSFEVFGTDSLQAVNLASNVEPILKRLSSKYDFFWITGEPYFES